MTIRAGWLSTFDFVDNYLMSIHIYLYYEGKKSISHKDTMILPKSNSSLLRQSLIQSYRPDSQAFSAFRAKILALLTKTLITSSYSFFCSMETDGSGEFRRVAACKITGMAFGLNSNSSSC